MIRTYVLAVLFALIALPAQADPIKLYPVKVTASSNYAGSDPLSAVDGDSSTVWDAGGAPTQWIQLDLGRTVSIRRIRLQVAQSPAGTTRHMVAVGQDESHLTDVKKFFQHTSNGQWLEYALDGTELGPVRFLRITTHLSPSRVAWKEIEIYQGLEYLGYFGDAVSGNGNGNYIEVTTSNGANLVMIGGTTEDYQAKLLEAHNRGAKAILDLSYQLFSDPNLRSDWEAQWSKIVSIVQQAPPNTVAAFYPHDEPYGSWNIPDNPASRAAMKDMLQAVATRIRQDFPTMPIAVIINAVGLREYNLDPSYVSMFDWVGFDCYKSWDDCKMPTLITKLRSWLSLEQRMIAVPWAFQWGDSVSVQAQDERLQNIAKWHEEILGDAKYVAVVPFLWQTMDLNSDGTPDLGTEDLPRVKARLHQLAQNLLPSAEGRVFSPRAGPLGANDLPGQ